MAVDQHRTLRRWPCCDATSVGPVVDGMAHICTHRPAQGDERACTISSGGLTCRNDSSRAKSYTIFRHPQAISGHPANDAGRIIPAKAGLSDDARLRGTAVTLAAAVRSAGVTTAMTYDVRVGTSICESAGRTSISPSTTKRFVEKAARTRQRLEGMCVNTIV